MEGPNTSKKRNRISVLFDDALLERTRKHARQVGIPISKLLQGWIKTTDVIRLEKIDSKDLDTTSNHSTRYNFYTDLETNKKLKESAKHHGLNVSSYLRALTIFKLRQVKDPSVKSSRAAFFVSLHSPQTPESIGEIRKLWRGGKLTEITEKYTHIVEQLNPLDIVYVARAHLALENLKKAEQINELILELKLPTDQTQLFILGVANHIKAEIKLHELDFIAYTKYTNACLQIGNKMQDRTLIGLYHSLQVQACRLREEFQAGLAHANTALEFFDIYNHKVEILKTYFRVIRIASNSLIDKELTRSYLERSEHLLDSFEDNALSASLYNVMGDAYYFAEGDLVKMNGAIRNSIEISKKSNLHINLSNTLETYAEAFFCSGHYAWANKLLQRAIKADDQTSFGQRMSMLKVLQDTLRATDNYRSAMKDMKKDLDLNRAYKPSSRKFFYYSNMYTLGDTPEEKRNGERGLRKLQTETQSLMLRRAVNLTLSSKHMKVSQVDILNV